MHSADCFLQMNLGKALSIFKQFGIDAAGMSASEVKAARNRLLEVCHPDRGGPVELAQKINAAYELLKNGVASASERERIWRDPIKPADETRYEAPSGAFWGKENGWPMEPASRIEEERELRKEAVPDWAWAGFSGGPRPDAQIRRNSFADQNFFKKSMWELSGKSKREYSVWGYDGVSFSLWITVYGSPAIFNHMAAAMVEWQNKRGTCRAVFANERGSRALHLLYADGRYYGEDPLKISHNAFNENPENDTVFARVTVPRFLDRIARDVPEEAAAF